MVDMIRAFICIDFSDEVIKEVARVQELVSRKKFVGKMTELENLHLTLKFLGELTTDKIEEVKERLKSVKFEGFEASLGKCGVFSHRGNPKIVWVKTNGTAIYELQKKIDYVLKDIFPVEERFMSRNLKFLEHPKNDGHNVFRMSHLTIARIKHIENGEGFKKFVQGLSVRKINPRENLRPLGRSSFWSRRFSRASPNHDKPHTLAWVGYKPEGFGDV